MSKNDPKQITLLSNIILVYRRMESRLQILYKRKKEPVLISPLLSLYSAFTQLSISATLHSSLYYLVSTRSLGEIHMSKEIYMNYLSGNFYTSINH